MILLRSQVEILKDNNEIMEKGRFNFIKFKDICINSGNAM